MELVLHWENKLQTLLNRAHYENYICSSGKNFPRLYEPEDSLTCSQETFVGLYHEPVETGLHTVNILRIILNLILLFKLKFYKGAIYTFSD
jgi:hypothetical protein